MSGFRVKGVWEVTKKQEELLAVLESPETRREIMKILWQESRKYTPQGTGEGPGGHMVDNVTIRADGIVYHADYAQYQYGGEVYGPNIPEIVYDDQGNPIEIVAWHSKGKYYTSDTKYPTGRNLGEPGEFIMFKHGQYYKLWDFGYTNAGNGHDPKSQWLNMYRSWSSSARSVLGGKITRKLKGLLK